MWLIAAGSYFAFRDNAPSRLIGAQTESQIFYEDRSADLRAQVDGITSQKDLDQAQVEQRVNALRQQHARISLSLDRVEQKQVATLNELLSLDRVEQNQVAKLNEIRERIDVRARRMQSMLNDLGIKLGRASSEDATGGPFIPLKPPQSDANAFEAQLYRINVGRARSTAIARRCSQSQYANL